MWARNLEVLSQDRKVYAIDMLGFGRSSKNCFWNLRDATKNALQLRLAIESWREAVGLNEPFILLGHGFGAYIAMLYAFDYPQRVAHLIQVDPWGLVGHQTTAASAESTNFPAWVSAFQLIVHNIANPLSAVRLLGPLGILLVRIMRPDLIKKFEPLVGRENRTAVPDYLYHINADEASGEMAYKTMCTGDGWCKGPILDHFEKAATCPLDPLVNVTFLLGDRSWLDANPAIKMKQLLKDRAVDVHVLKGAGHHVYLDKFDQFNQLVKETCIVVDARITARRNPPEEVSDASSLNQND